MLVRSARTSGVANPSPETVFGGRRLRPFRGLGTFGGAYLGLTPQATCCRPFGPFSDTRRELVLPRGPQLQPHPPGQEQQVLQPLEEVEEPGPAQLLAQAEVPRPVEPHPVRRRGAPAASPGPPAPPPPWPGPPAPPREGECPPPAGDPGAPGEWGSRRAPRGTPPTRRRARLGTLRGEPRPRRRATASNP